MKQFPQDFHSFEEFVVCEILQHTDKDCTFIVGHAETDLNLNIDIYAPNGIPSLNYSGKTLIEVKKFLSYASIKNVESYFQRYGKDYNLLVVYFETSISNIPQREKNERGKDFGFISINELKSKSKKKEKNEKKYYNYNKKFENEDWKSIRNNIINCAQEIVKLGNNVLFLGAGVSASAQMPSWEELLKGLMSEIKLLKEPTRNAFKEMHSHIFEECGSSYLIMARYLQTAIHLYDDKEVFAELIQKHLYNNNDSSALLSILAHIIQQKKVSEVITYNFDNVLEQNLKKLQLEDSVDFTTISKDADIKGHNTLPIYHVHGIIPKSGPVDTVVFSEEEYHNCYTNAFHWSNIEQLHALSRMHCFL